MNDILAYHIVWTAYGTWLSGDERGWVERGRWEVQPSDPDKERWYSERMKESPILFTDDQRAIMKKAIADNCRIRGWTLHAHY